jgi:thiamine transporter 2/3
MLVLIPVFLITDIVLYKPVLVLESIAYILVWSALIWGRSVLSQQIGELMYGVATATEIAYYAYIYAKVDKTHYQKYVF